MDNFDDLNINEIIVSLDDIKPIDNKDKEEIKRKVVQRTELNKVSEIESSFDAKAFLKTVPHKPGCYRMLNAKNEIIYVGKAKDLKKRLSSYFLKNIKVKKTIALVSHIHSIEFTVTFSETEALILENNLIKENLPKYNILLRDDKSYPYILLTNSKHPALFYHKGVKKDLGEYFGPYPDSGAVKASLSLMQTIFPIRQCKDSVYKYRSRPCLLAQVKKCLAPCVFTTEKEEEQYKEVVNQVRLFLKGQNQELLNELTKSMQKHSESLEFEEAALVRDRLLALRRVQESQSIDSENKYDIDVVGYECNANLACVHILFIREGRILGTRSYYPSFTKNNSKDELISSFLAQFYLSNNRDNMYPKEIIIPNDFEDREILESAIKEVSNKNIKIVYEVRKDRAKYLTLAMFNAKESLKARIQSKTTAKDRIESLETLLNISNVERMECYDISHTQGENTIASCVVFNREGPDSKNYRRYNITNITKGDDFAAMHQVLTRRFKNVRSDDYSTIPDIVFIDGGLGQLKQAEEVLSSSFKDSGKDMPLMVGVAKGEGRKEGLETLILGFTHKRINLSLEDLALQLIIHIRDESHRFAITGHRLKRSKARTTSSLEQIEGVGRVRRKALLEHLGGMREVKAAGIDDLAKVPGISHELAIKIYNALH